MSKVFVKAEDLKLINGGYVTLSEGGTPVTNEAFIAAQLRAEYVVTFAKVAKGKDLVGKEATTVDEIKALVAKELATKATTYVDVPEATKGDITSKLAAEALAFTKAVDGQATAKKVNEFMAEFDIIHEFEEFGLFFDQGIVKLKKIYTIKEIVEAVEATIDLLD